MHRHMYIKYNLILISVHMLLGIHMYYATGADAIDECDFESAHSEDSIANAPKPPEKNIKNSYTIAELRDIVPGPTPSVNYPSNLATFRSLFSRRTVLRNLRLLGTAVVIVIVVTIVVKMYSMIIRYSLILIRHILNFLHTLEQALKDLLRVHMQLFLFFCNIRYLFVSKPKSHPIISYINHNYTHFKQFTKKYDKYVSALYRIISNLRLLPNSVFYPYIYSLTYLPKYIYSLTSYPLEYIYSLTSYPLEYIYSLTSYPLEYIYSLTYLPKYLYNSIMTKVYKYGYY